jgi:hypothetical protein
LAAILVEQGAAHGGLPELSPALLT